MNDLDPVGKLHAEIEGLLDAVPEQHRGLSFERLLTTVAFQENTRLLERAFALEWVRVNEQSCNNILSTLIFRDTENDPRVHLRPKNAREWQIACLVAATVIQWLPTSVGCGFLRRAFERGGGSFSYQLPKVPEDPKALSAR